MSTKLNKAPKERNKLEKLLDFLEWFRRGVIVPITVVRFMYWVYTVLTKLITKY